RAPLERRKTPVAELDQEPAQEEAARLLPGTLVLEAAHHGHTDGVSGEQNSGAGGKEEDQRQPPDEFPARCAAGERGKLITAQVVPGRPPARGANGYALQVSNLRHFCNIASIWTQPGAMRSHTGSRRKDQQDQG